MDKSTTVHNLKTWPDEFEATAAGEKTFELRRNDDRSFKVGDFLQLYEYNPEADRYTGNTLMVKVVYLVDPVKFGLGSGFVAMGIELV